MIRAIKSSIRNKTWKFLKAKWKLASGVEIIIENDSDWFVFNEIFSSKEYDKAIELLWRYRTPDDPLILDLGANVGYFSLKIADELLLHGYPRFHIIAVEGSPVNFPVCHKRLNQPKLAGMLHSYLGLAGHKTGTNKVIHSEQHYGHSAAAAGAGKSLTVPYIDIEALLPDKSRRIQLLKCDIEGSEEIFIEAYRYLLQRVDHAVFEFHAGECNVEHCKQMLEETGLIWKEKLKEDPPFKTTVEVFSRR